MKNKLLYIFIHLLLIFSFSIHSQSFLNFKSPSLLQLKFNENGDMELEGYYFENVTNEDLRKFPQSPPIIFPPTSFAIKTPTFIPDPVSENRIWKIDGKLFFQGQFYPNTTSFPPSNLKYFNSQYIQVACFTDDGDLYIAGDYSNIGSCNHPVYEPNKWNDDPYILRKNNCYNYGNNQITYTFSQPGLASGNMYQAITVEEVKRAAIDDGLEFIGFDFPGNDYDCGDNEHLVFMCIDPGWDYHWYRYDNNIERWSHKPGGTEATDLDAANPPNEITNPLTADRGGYTENGGFYCTCGNNAFIR